MLPIYFASACSALTHVSCNTGLPATPASAANLNRILSVVFAILGAVAVMMIVIGAFNFVNSEGDPQKTSRARGTVIYALVGLIVAILAEVIVAFVLWNL